MFRLEWHGAKEQTDTNMGMNDEADTKKTI